MLFANDRRDKHSKPQQKQGFRPSCRSNAFPTDNEREVAGPCRSWAALLHLKIRQKPAVSHQNRLSKSGGGATWVNESTSVNTKVSLKQDRREDGANSNINNGSASLDVDDSARTMRRDAGLGPVLLPIPSTGMRATLGKRKQPRSSKLSRRQRIGKTFLDSATSLNYTIGHNVCIPRSDSGFAAGNNGRNAYFFNARQDCACTIDGL
jgi:hypothetical protein